MSTANWDAVEARVAQALAVRGIDPSAPIVTVTWQEAAESAVAALVSRGYAPEAVTDELLDRLFRHFESCLVLDDDMVAICQQRLDEESGQ